MELNRQIVGASIIGVALVAGSYVLSNLTRPNPVPALVTVAVTTTSEPRTYIPVTDSNNDGIEDWREEFVSAEPITLPSSTSTFTMPDTITDQIGIQFFESSIREKNRGTLGNQKDLVVRTAERLDGLSTDVLYTEASIITVPTSPEVIRMYANTIAESMMAHNIDGSEDPLVLIERALRTESRAELAQVNELALMYKALRDDALNTPVPEPFTKAHLDLINVYHSLYRTLTDAQLIFDDPVVALMRLKRYQDDATGLAFALNNMYQTALPYSNLFSETDPAYIFTLFAINP
jgi:hypothetical protein